MTKNNAGSSFWCPTCGNEYNSHDNPGMCRNVAKNADKLRIMQEWVIALAENTVTTPQQRAIQAFVRKTLKARAT